MLLKYGVISRLIAPAFCLLLADPNTVHAHTTGWKFTKLVDSNTPIPGEEGTFGLIEAGDFTDGDLVFATGPFGSHRIWTLIGGSFRLVADRSTANPSGTGNFTQLVNPRIKSGHVTFEACSIAFCGSGGFKGVYLDDGTNLHVVADENTFIPGETVKFANVGTHSHAESEQVLFNGHDSATTKFGIYSWNGGVLDVVANQDTPIPGGAGTFTTLSNPQLDGDDIGFLGLGSSGQSGFYTLIGGVLDVVVDTNTAIPGGTGNFTEFGGYPSMDAGNSAFIGFGGSNQWGVYTLIGGVLDVVADTNTPRPSAAGNFTEFRSVHLDGDSVAFDGNGGVYTNIGGGLKKVIDTTDTLDGKTLSQIHMAGETGTSLSGTSLGFLAIFSDGTQGIYRADLLQLPFLCEVAMSQRTYIVDETLEVATLRFANLSAGPLRTRLRLQLLFETLFTGDILDVGADGTFGLPAGFDKVFGPAPLFNVKPTMPQGTWSMRCALEDPVNGAIQAEGFFPFKVE